MLPVLLDLKDAFQKYTCIFRLKCQLKHTACFRRFFQVSADEGMGKQSKCVEFSTQKLFQICACVISARKAEHFDATTVFTYSHANTPLGQSERAYYLSYFINNNTRHTRYT